MVSLILLATYFAIGIFVSRRYYFRRHGVKPTPGCKGLTKASAVGMTWPASLWIAGVRNPTDCKCHQSPVYF